jgi:preprotein translocase subunit YajC
MGIIAAAQAAASKSNSSSYFLLLIVLVFVGFYFLVIRPQRRRQQSVVQQQRTVSPGARVRTTAGMYADVVAVDGDDVVLEIAPGVQVRYMKRAIMEVVSPGTEEEPEDTEAEYSEHVDDDVTSAEGDDDLASSNGTKAKTDTEAF